MEAHLAPKQPIQVNKITSLCEICSGPHDTQYCMENHEQAFVEYASSCTDKVGELVQGNVINEVKNLLPKFLPKAISDFVTLVIQSTVKKALEKTPTTLAQSSSQAQSSLKAAESLSEYELKNILYEKIDKSHSYLIHDKHQALFDDLFKSLCLDDVVAHGQANPEKILRKRDHDGDDKDEDPSARPNHGKKTKRRKTKESESSKKKSTTKGTKESDSSKKTSTTKETSKGNAPTKGSKFDKFVHAEESVGEPTKKVIMDASNNDVVNDADQPQNDFAPKHNWFTQPPRPRTPDPE
nr:MAK10-like protein [Tanacetum cinerariifolium]